VRTRVRATGWETCVVVNDAGVVLGRLGRRALRDDGTGVVEDAMTPGPSTVRPGLPLSELSDRMRRGDLQSALVTRSDGTLVGVARREDVDAEARSRSSGPTG
jgi:CBS domain-containing protein